MIFVSSCECGLGLDTVEWLRGWIAEVGDEPLVTRTTTNHRGYPTICGPCDGAAQWIIPIGA
jgi:hypothetical protein